jgi:PAS domain S-box-containing protein
MNHIAKFVVEHVRLAWALALAVITVLAIGAGSINRDIREQQRLTLLETEAERRAIDVMSQTVNGNLMGSVAMLGLIDQEIKREAKGEGKPNASGVLRTLESVGRSYDADGVFVVAADGVIKSSWDNAGKPSTGLNVKFRPYYQMAMQGNTNIYAAVSLARGDRSLYFSVPVFIETTNATEAIGAVVARTGLDSVDDVLRNKTDIALLLSPQGVVFASTRKEWIGFLAGTPTPERLKAIRELKQFGNMFDKKEPSPLPIATTLGRYPLDGKHYAVATAPVKWNDVSGDWQLVMLEDLDRTVSAGERFWVIGITFFGLLSIAVLVLFILRGQHAQLQSAAQLKQFAGEQERHANYKARLAAASVKFQQVTDLQALGQLFLREVHDIFGVLQSVFYGADQHAGERMQLIASFACAQPPAAELAVGEGMLGQCASERRVIVLNLPDDESLTIRSGLGDMRPRSVLLMPVILNERLLGVVEFALSQALSPAQQSSLEELVGLLAMNIEIVSRSSSTAELLEATRAAHEANAEQLAFQQALIDTIPYPVFYKGADTRFLGFNTAYEKTFNVSRSELIGKCVLDLDYLPEADRVAYQAEDEAVIAGTTTVEREMRIPFADGKVHDTLYYVSGFRRPDGSPGGLVGTFIDISEMKQTQAEVARLANISKESQA